RRLLLVRRPVKADHRAWRIQHLAARSGRAAISSSGGAGKRGDRDAGPRAWGKGDCVCDLTGRVPCHGRRTPRIRWWPHRRLQSAGAHPLPSVVAEGSDRKNTAAGVERDDDPLATTGGERVTQGHDWPQWVLSKGMSRKKFCLDRSREVFSRSSPR